MARFTAEQKRTSEAMKQLIGLYYWLKETEQEGWFSPEAIDKVATVIDLTIPKFTPCLYFQHNSFFRYGGPDNSIKYWRKDIESFFGIMKVLEKKLNEGILQWFEIKGRTIESREEFEKNDPEITDFRQMLAVEATDLSDICISIPPLPENADDEDVDRHLALRAAALNRPPGHFDSFHVKDHYDYDDPDTFDLEDGDRISSPGYFRPDAGFIHVVKYLLVKYQFLFESFERIKLCKQCRKLFFEKRLRSGEFCSGTCRKRHHDSLQDPEKRRCRERQNAWIRYRHDKDNWPSAFTIQTDDCVNCHGPVGSGMCTVLKRKNSRGFGRHKKTVNPSPKNSHRL